MGAINEQVKGILDKLYNDTLVPGLELTVPVTIERFLRLGYDPTSAGTDLTSVGISSVNGLLRPITRDEVNSSQGLLELTDSVLFIRYDGFLINEGLLNLDNKISLGITTGVLDEFVIIQRTSTRVGTDNMSIKMVIRRVSF